MPDKKQTDKGMVLTGILFSAAGIWGFINLSDATTLTLIIGPFVCTPLGLYLIIRGLVQKSKKNK